MTTKLTPKPKLSLVAFIDMLGFAKRAKEMKTERDLAALASDVALVQKWFERKPRDELREHHAHARKSVLAFSDCIVVGLPFKSAYTRLYGTFDAFGLELWTFALNQGECAVRGIFLRGALDVGIWYRRGDQLISDALAKAYELERQMVMPVIGLSHQFHGYLTRDPGRVAYTEDADPTNTFITTDPTNVVPVPFLDYMSVCLDSADWITSKARHEAYRRATPEKREQIMARGFAIGQKRFLRQHASMIRRAKKRAKDSHVRAKYEWLTVYHNRVASNAGHSDCLI